jgi:hypothetical protein
MQAVPSKKNIASAERLVRDLAHTEREIAYYLDRLDIIDDQGCAGLRRSAGASAGFQRRDCLSGPPQGPTRAPAARARKRDEKVLVLASHRQSRWATAAHRSSRLTTSRAWSMSTVASSSTTTSRMRQTTASFSIGCQWRPCRCWMLISSVCSPTAATRRSGDRRMRARQH